MVCAWARISRAETSRPTRTGARCCDCCCSSNLSAYGAGSKGRTKMPLQGPGHFKENVRTLMHEVGKSPHVQSREQALAIAYAKERGRQEGGSVQARLKRAPNREMPNRPAPIRDLPDFPMSENIEDRRGDIAGSLWSGLK